MDFKVWTDPNLKTNMILAMLNMPLYDAVPVFLILK